MGEPFDGRTSSIVASATSATVVSSFGQFVELFIDLLVGIFEKLNELQGLLAVFTREKRVGSTLGTGTRCTTNAMNVIFSLARIVKIYDDANVIHI